MKNLYEKSPYVSVEFQNPVGLNDLVRPTGSVHTVRLDGAEIERLEARIAELEAQTRELLAVIQKINAIAMESEPTQKWREEYWMQRQLSKIVGEASVVLHGGKQPLTPPPDA